MDICGHMKDFHTTITQQLYGQCQVGDPTGIRTRIPGLEDRCLVLLDDRVINACVTARQIEGLRDLMNAQRSYILAIQANPEEYTEDALKYLWRITEILDSAFTLKLRTADDINKQADDVTELYKLYDLE